MPTSCQAKVLGALDEAKRQHARSLQTRQHRFRVGARVTGVPLREQRIQGGVLSRFYQECGIGDGDQFRVAVTGLDE